jgi:hypothetical protein
VLCARVVLDIVIQRDICKVMFHLVYYAKYFICSSCLEGVPLVVFKKLGYCSWLSRIGLCTKSGSLSLDSF